MQKTHSVHSCQADYGRGKCNHFFSCVRPCCLNMLNNAHAGYINKSVTDRYWTTCLIRRRGIAVIAVDIYATVHSTVSTHKRFWLEEDSYQVVKYTFLEGGCQLQFKFFFLAISPPILKGLVPTFMLNFPKHTNSFPFWWISEELWPCQQGSLVFRSTLCISTSTLIITLFVKTWHSNCFLLELGSKLVKVSLFYR